MRWFPHLSTFTSLLTLRHTPPASAAGPGTPRSDAAGRPLGGARVMDPHLRLAELTSRAGRDDAPCGDTLCCAVLLAIVGGTAAMLFGVPTLVAAAVAGVGAVAGILFANAE